MKARALRQALERLSTLGLINGDTGAASAILIRLIADAFGRGERSEENLILYAIGRFQAHPGTDGRQPKKEP